MLGLVATLMVGMVLSFVLCLFVKEHSRSYSLYTVTICLCAQFILVVVVWGIEELFEHLVISWHM